MMKKWQVENNAKIKNVRDLVKNILENRGIRTKKETEQFLNPNFSRITLSSLKINEAQIKKTLARIKKAIKYS